jgi:hypothetical protein
MDWIDLGQDRDKWRAHVNVVMTLWLPKWERNSWLAEDLRRMTASLNHTMVSNEWKCPMLPNPNNRTTFWKDPRLHPFASWYEQYGDEDEYGALVEWHWRGMTKGEYGALVEWHWCGMTKGEQWSIGGMTKGEYGAMTLTWDDQRQVWSSGGMTLMWDDQRRVRSIGGMTVMWDDQRRVWSIGGMTLMWDDQGRVWSNDTDMGWPKASMEHWWNDTDVGWPKASMEQWHWRGMTKGKYGAMTLTWDDQNQVWSISGMTLTWDDQRWVWSIDGMTMTAEWPKYSEKILSQCHFVNHKSHMAWPLNVPRSPWWEASE